MNGTADYLYETRGRNPKTITVFLGLAGALIALLTLVQMAWGWGLFFGLFLLPLAWDILSDRRTLLRISPVAVAWARPGGAAEVPRAEIAHLDLRIRLDQSVKLQVQLRDGRCLSAPPEALPGPAALERALVAAGYEVRRHPFALL